MQGARGIGAGGFHCHRRRSAVIFRLGGLRGTTLVPPRSIRFGTDSGARRRLDHTACNIGHVPLNPDGDVRCARIQQQR